MNVLLSIKPKYVKEIKSGNKRFEFRKSIFNKKKIDQIRKIFIYSTSPVKKIVARFLIKQILEDSPEELWERCKRYSGIDEKDFFRYFRNKEKGFAIEITNLKFFREPIEPQSVIPNFTAPQSFRYIDDLENYKEITEFL